MAYIPPNQMASAGAANAQQSQVSPTPSRSVPMAQLDQARATTGYAGSIPPAVPVQSSPAVSSPQPGQAALSPAPQTSAAGTAGTSPVMAPVAAVQGYPDSPRTRPTLPTQASPVAQAAVAKAPGTPMASTALQSALARVPEQARSRVMAALSRVTGPQQAALNQRVQALQAQGMSPEQVQVAVAPQLRELELAAQQALAGMNVGVPMSAIDQLRAARGNFNAR